MAFTAQIESLKLTGNQIYMLNLHLSEAKEAGFPPKHLAPMRKTFGSKLNEITMTKIDLQKFVDGLSPVEKASLLDISSHCGKYATDWMEAFKPLFDDFEKLINELRGKEAVKCTIDRLRYPVWDPKWNIYLPGCPFAWISGAHMHSSICFIVTIYLGEFVTIYVFQTLMGKVAQEATVQTKTTECLRMRGRQLKVIHFKKQCIFVR